MAAVRIPPAVDAPRRQEAIVARGGQGPPTKSSPARRALAGRRKVGMMGLDIEAERER